MDLESVSQKHLNELEVRVTELLLLLKKAKIQDENIIAILRQLETELGQARRDRFDGVTKEYSGY
jgi:hypothetical protein